MFVSESRRWHTLIAFGAFIIAMPYFGATVVPSVSVPVTSELESHGGRLGSLPQLAAPADPPVVRTDFSKLGPGAVAALRKGIAEMMKLDVGKPDNMLSPLGWKYQASIHGSLPGAMKQPAWDTCQHSSWFFLSWHRMELYFFERILRAMSGDPKLTLPYWNFSVPPAGMDPTKFGARLPAAFRVKPTVAAPNSLWWEFRDAGVNKPPGPGAMDTATPLSHDDVATLKAFSQSAFFSNTKAMGMMSFGGGALPKDFHDAGAAGGGQIERIPHNQIHGAVGLGDKDPQLRSVIG